MLNRPRLALAVTAASALVVASLAPAAGQIRDRDRRAGAQANTQILAEFGGAYNGPGTAMVGRVGRAMAIQSGLSKTGAECTVTTLNTPVVNAFAIPGCYIYVTRGLLAIMNDEAELASVLGHEIGHVAARHAQKRQNRSIFAGIGAMAAAVLTGSSQVGQLAGQAGQRLVLGYSRGQEYEADTLGIDYMRGAGYAPAAAADMLESLEAEDQLQARLRGRDEAAQVPAWARSHPLTRDRITRAAKIARDSGTTGGATNADAYLAAVDGQLWGDDPVQGIVDGREFAHPGMRIAFTAPPGFYIQNGTRAVTVSGPGNVQAKFSDGGLQGGEALQGYTQRLARSLVGNAPVEVGRFQETTTNGVRSALLPLRVNSNRGPLDVTISAYDGGGGQAYHFIALAPTSAGSGAIEQLLGSFRRLSASEAAAIRPRVLRVVTVRAGDTVETLARQMAVRDLPVERFRALNDIPAGGGVRPGQRVKLVRLAGR